MQRIEVCCVADEPVQAARPGQQKWPSAKAASWAALILTGCLLSGCASWFPTQKGYRQALDTWIGSTGEQLVAQWGVPAGEHTSPSGSKIYQYKNERSYSVSGGTKQQEVRIDGKYVTVDIPQPDETETTWCNTTFYLNQDDIIESYRFAGPDCTAREKSAD